MSENTPQTHPNMSEKMRKSDPDMTKKWPARAGNRTRYLGILRPRTNPLGYFGTRNELSKESLCFKNTELASQLLFFQNKSFFFQDKNLDFCVLKTQNLDF